MFYKGHKNIYMILQKIKQYLFFQMILKIAMDKANDKQNKLTQKIRNFRYNTKPRNPNMIKEKPYFVNSAIAVLERKINDF